MASTEVQGRVTAIVDNGQSADVVVEAALPCARCREGRGCGAGVFGASSGPRVIRVRVPSDLRVAEGDTVHLTTSGDSLLEAALTAWGLPLAGLLAGGLAATMVSASDGVAVMLAVTGIAAGGIAARRRAGRQCWQEDASGLVRLSARAG